MNWSVQADPKTLPQLGPVMNEDFENAIATTKAASHQTTHAKYQKWMEEFGSV